MTLFFGNVRLGLLFLGCRRCQFRTRMHSVNTRIMHFIEFVYMYVCVFACFFSKLLTAWTDNVLSVWVCTCDNLVGANLGWLDRWVAGN